MPGSRRRASAASLIRTLLGAPAPRRRRTRRPAAAPRPASRTPGSWRPGRYAGAAGSRAYFLHVPTGLRGAAPLVLALHGCDQSAEDFAAATRWNELADRHGFVVAYPQQSVAHHPQRCWNWFRTTHQHRGGGEPAVLTGIVAQIAGQQQAWRVDRSRIFVVGLSAGGAMALVLAATYPELFAAVAVHSAPPYASATTAVSAVRAMSGRTPVPGPPPGAAPMPPLVVFQGSSDPIVSPGNASRIAEQWLAYAGPGAPVRLRQTCTAAARPRTTTSRRGSEVQRWYAGARRVLEVWTVEGLGHAWSGGKAGAPYSDRRGPRATTEIWRFFTAVTGS